jgi:hypothetical protein
MMPLHWPKKFHLFGPLKGALHGTRFEDDESVIRALRTWLRELETSRYKEGKHALDSRWRKDVDGDYVGKITCIKETSSYTVREYHTF